ncbi:MAG: ABC transporter permease [Chloroflexota bacterium]
MKADDSSFPEETDHVSAHVEPIFSFDSQKLPPKALHELIELWQYRDLLRLLVVNRIKTRYKRSVLGVIWTLLNPLLNTLVLTIAFSQLFRFNLPNYAIYLLVGLLFWNFFSQSINDSMHTLVWGSGLLKRIYVPRAIFAVAVIGNALINYLLALIPLVLIMAVLHQPFTNALWFLPGAVLILAMFTLGFGLLVSTVAVFFVDFVDLFGVLLSAWFYLTPIIYPLSIIPPRWLPVIRLNPLVHLVELFRAIIYQGVMPAAGAWLVSLVLASVTLVAGWLIFTSKVDEFAYHI